MDTNTLSIFAAELHRGDRIMTIGVAKPWPGPFVASVYATPAVTLVRTVNGGELTLPSSSVIEVVRGALPTGDPSEGW